MAAPVEMAQRFPLRGEWWLRIGSKMTFHQATEDDTLESIVEALVDLHSAHAHAVDE